MPELARIVHSVPGRARVRVPGAKWNPDLLFEIRASLAQLEGVREVKAQPATNGFTVHYERYTPSQFLDALAEHGRSTGLYTLAPPETPAAVDHQSGARAEPLPAQSDLARFILETARNADWSVKRATNNTFDLKFFVPAVSAVMSTLVGTKARTPLWLNLAMFSFNSFHSLHRRPQQTELPTNVRSAHEDSE